MHLTASLHTLAGKLKTDKKDWTNDTIKRDETNAVPFIPHIVQLNPLRKNEGEKRHQRFASARSDKTRVLF